MSNIAEFADIQEYSVTGNLTLQGARDLVMDIYTENYKKVYAKAPPLYDSDPLTLTLKSMAMLYYMAMQVAERRALAAMLKSAEGAQLDNIGLPFGVKRNPATYATVTIRFTLSAAQKSVAMIPQGTRIRTGAGIYLPRRNTPRSTLAKRALMCWQRRKKSARKATAFHRALLIRW